MSLIENDLTAGADLVQILKDLSFSTSAYREEHPDLLAAALDDEAALQHFLNFGYREDRCARSDIFSIEHEPKIKYLLSLPGRPAEMVKALVKGGIKALNEEASVWPAIDVSLISTMQYAEIDPYIVIGDSHSRLYLHYGVVGRADIAPIHLLCSAGSAAGLSNVGSRSQYGVHLLSWARAAADVINQSNIPVFLKFGQVDAEFVTVFKRIRDKETIFSIDKFEEFSTKTVESYFLFIDDLSKLIAPSLLRVCSIFPPTLSDSAWAAGYINAHVGQLEGDRDVDLLIEEVKALQIPDLRTRISLHSIFNSELQRQSARRNIDFLNDFAPLVGLGGLVEGAFMAGHSGEDHHLSFGHIQETVRRQICRFMAPRNPLLEAR